MMPRIARWRDDDLRLAVRESRSLRQVCLRLGLRPGGGTVASIRRHIERLRIDDGHLARQADGRIKTARSWNDDDLRDAVRASVSLAGVQRRLGYQPSGGMHRYLTHRITLLGLDTGHFTGQGWAKGTRRQGGFCSRPLGEVLVSRSTYSNSARLRQRLINEGLKEPRCERCGLDAWFGEQLPLALDHINGDPCDNRLENLRILCPNCHALTDTWCGRKRRRRTPTGREIRLRT